MEDKRNLTEEEELAVGHAMMKAALKALGKVPATAEEEDQDPTAWRVARAFVAAQKVRRSERKRLEEEKGGYVRPETGVHDALATAFWMWSEKYDFDVSDVPPASAPGSRLLALAQGLAAAYLVKIAREMMEEDEWIFAYVGEGAEYLARSFVPEGNKDG